MFRTNRTICWGFSICNLGWNNACSGSSAEIESRQQTSILPNPIETFFCMGVIDYEEAAQIVVRGGFVVRYDRMSTRRRPVSKFVDEQMRRWLRII
jgi:hypothetical protein